jgi:gas vesicle protein
MKEDPIAERIAHGPKRGQEMKNQRTLLATVALAALVLAPACRSTAEGVKEDSRQNAERARHDAQAIKEQSEDAAHKVAEGVKDVGEAIKDGAREVGSEVGAKKQTVDIEAALTLDKSIDASHIDVDTDADTKTVTIKGTVPTSAQRTAVERVARDKAEGYQIRNLLTVVKNP